MARFFFLRNERSAHHEIHLASMRTGLGPVFLPRADARSSFLTETASMRTGLGPVFLPCIDSDSSLTSASFNEDRAWPGFSSSKEHVCLTSHDRASMRTGLGPVFLPALPPASARPVPVASMRTGLGPVFLPGSPAKGCAPGRAGFNEDRAWPGFSSSGGTRPPHSLSALQ